MEAACTPENTHMMRLLARAARKMNLIPPEVPSVESMADPDVDRTVLASTVQVRQVAQLRSEVFGPGGLVGNALTQPTRNGQRPRKRRKGASGAVQRP